MFPITPRSDGSYQVVFCLTLLLGLLSSTLGATIPSITRCAARDSDYGVTMSHETFEGKRRVFLTVEAAGQIVPLSNMVVSHSKRAHIVSFSTSSISKKLFFTHSHPEEFGQIQPQGLPSDKYSLVFDLSSKISGSDVSHDFQVGITIQFPECDSSVEIERTLKIPADGVKLDSKDIPIPQSIAPGRIAVAPVQFFESTESIHAVDLDELSYAKSNIKYLVSAPLLASDIELPVASCVPILINVASVDSKSNTATPLESLRRLLSMAAHIAAYNSETGEIVHTHGMGVALSDVPESYQNAVKTAPNAPMSVSGLDEVTGPANTCRQNHRLMTRSPHSGMHMTPANKFGPWISIPLILPSAGTWRVVVQMLTGESLIISTLIAKAQ